MKHTVLIAQGAYSTLSIKCLKHKCYIAQDFFNRIPKETDFISF